MKKLLILAICSLALLTACSQKADLYESQLVEEKPKFTERMNEKEKNIEELNQKISQLNTQINDLNKEKENIVFISNTSMEFIQAQAIGDKDKLRELLSEDIILLEKDNELSISEDGVETPIFDKEKKLSSWVIRGYDYDSKTNTYNVFIAEYYRYLNGEPETPPTVVNLHFINNNDRWEINSLDFDV